MNSYASFAPIIFQNSKTLILGSFPSVKSIENDFYYAHPKNQFWPILADIYKAPIKLKEEKIALLQFAKIALWDMAASCERINSADSNLKNIKINDIELLLKEYQNINRIFFTGRKAEELYKKRFSQITIQTKLLPSPSPAYASVGFKEKLNVWSLNLIV